MGSFEIFKKHEMLPLCIYALVNEEFIWICTGPKIAKTVFKKNKVGVLTPFDFKTIQIQ